MISIKGSDHWWVRWWWQLLEWGWWALWKIGVHRRASTDAYVGMVLSWPDLRPGHEGQRQERIITKYDKTTNTITIDEWP